MDTTAPAAPTGLVATAGDSSVSLDWDDNGELDPSYFNGSEYSIGSNDSDTLGQPGQEKEFAFTDFSTDPHLTEPRNGGCNAGMAVFPRGHDQGGDIIVFSNPGGTGREEMTVRASFDGGRSWHFVRKGLPASAATYEWTLPPLKQSMSDIRLRVVVWDHRFQSSSDMVSSMS